MNIEEFNLLDHCVQNNYVCDAEKIAEYSEELATYTLFLVKDVYLLVTVSKNRSFKKRIEAITKTDIPARLQTSFLIR
jgi:hypothetical protein